MISTPTVFVLGAGASKAYGFPTGPELRHFLAKHVLATHHDSYHTSHPIGPIGWNYREALMNAGCSPDLLDKCKERLGRSWATSIDMFMSTQNDEVRRACTLAIVLAIATFEQREEDLFYAPPGGDWFRYLWRFLHRGCSKAEHVRTRHRVSFVTFNYDRTLEWSLANAMSHAFDTPMGEVFDLLPTVVHVHGHLGDLRERRYGYPPEAANLALAADHIRVVDPNATRTRDVDRAREIIAGAGKIVFLGFGYDETNLQILGVQHGRSLLNESCNCFGTFYRMESQEIESALRFIDTGHKTVNMAGHMYGRFQDDVSDQHDCLTLLRRHHREIFSESGRGW